MTRVDHLVSITVAGETYFVYVSRQLFHGTVAWMWLHDSVDRGRLATA